MTCLGGTREEPQEWLRVFDGMPVEQLGRVQGCKNEDRDTRRRLCHGCPAFRGVDMDGVEQTGILPDGTVVALTLREGKQYQRWVIDELEPERFYSWMEGGARRGWKTIEGGEASAEYMREWRADHPGYDKRKRVRAEYMRGYRKARSVTRNNFPRARGEEVS